MLVSKVQCEWLGASATLKLAQVPPEQESHAQCHQGENRVRSCVVGPVQKRRAKAQEERQSQRRGDEDLVGSEKAHADPGVLHDNAQNTLVRIRLLPRSSSGGASILDGPDPRP